MKKFFEYTLEILIGLALIIFVEDIRWFLMFFLICVVWFSHQIVRHIDFNRKILRVLRVSTDVKLLALADKIGVSRDDMKKIFAGMKAGTSKEDLESLKKDTRDVTGAIILDDELGF